MSLYFAIFPMSNWLLQWWKESHKSSIMEDMQTAEGFLLLHVFLKMSSIKYFLIFIGHPCVICQLYNDFENSWRCHAWLSSWSHLGYVLLNKINRISSVLKGESTAGYSGPNQHCNSMETISIAKVNDSFLYFIPLTE